MTHATSADKFRLPNHGVPVFCDPERQLAAVPGATQDSWYVKFHFHAEGKEIGFIWHQHATGAAPDARSWFGEFVLMDGTDKLWRPALIDEPDSDNIDASADECRVRSSFGTLSGDRHRLELVLAQEHGAADLVLLPQAEVLLNGTTGYLALLTGSYQFAFPNMTVQGTVTIDGHVYDVPEGTTAWFDRQWSFTLAADGLSKKAGDGLPAWLWIGTPLSDAKTAAISLWDVFAGGTRRSFATILDAQGLQYNVLAEVEYDEIWTSRETGESYPRKVHVRVPAADLKLSFVAMLDEPVYNHGDGAISGCMSLSTMKGSYRGDPIDGHYILEMIGNLCG